LWFTSYGFRLIFIFLIDDYQNEGSKKGSKNVGELERELNTRRIGK